MSFGSSERVGRWSLVRPLGRGGMGQVWRAVDDRGAVAAVKLLLRPGEHGREAMRAEIRALAQLRHPGVVDILEHGVHDGVPWYAMELVEGPTLGALTRATDMSTVSLDDLDSTPVEAQPAGVLDFGETVRVCARVCEALAHVHGEGLVHLDLKPANIVLRPDGDPVLVDFGLASPTVGRSGRESLGTTPSGAGTVSYMAPEQITGDTVDARADLYALGCMLYSFTAGCAPFRGPPEFVLWQHLAQAPAPPSDLAPLPAAFDDLVLRLLRKAPGERPGRALDVRAELLAIGGFDLPFLAGPPRPVLYRPSFRGRDDVIARLDRHLEDVRAGRGGLVRLTAEPGVGRTRLLNEVARRAGKAGFTALIGRASDGRRPLHPLAAPLAALAEAARDRGSDEVEAVFGPRRGILAPYSPAVAALPGPDAEALPAEAALDRAFTALADTLDAAAEPSSGVVVLLDDLEHADPITRRFLEYLDPSLTGPDPLARAPLAARSVLVVGTWRAGADPWPRAVNPAIELAPLSAEAVAAIVADACGGPDPRIPSTVAAAAGNPFAAMAALRESSHRPTQDGSTQAVLAAVAVAGASSAERIAAMSDLPIDAVHDALRRLLAEEVLVERGDRADLCNQRVAAAALSASDPDTIARLHARAAATLRAGAADALERARHLDAAGESSRDAWLAAARFARTQGALDEAADCYERALADMGEADGAVVRIELAAEVLRLLGRIDAALATAERAATAARDAGDARLEAEARHALGLAAWSGGRLAEAERCQREAIGLWRAVADPVGETRTLGALALTVQQQGRRDEARSLYAVAIAGARRSGDARTEAHALANLGMLEFEQGGAADAIRAWEEALGRLEALGDRRARAVVLGNLGSALGAAGDLEAAEARLAQGLAAAREVGHRLSEAHTLGNLGQLHLHRGRPDLAIAATTAALALHGAIGDLPGEVRTRAQLASLLRGVGRLEEAEQTLEAAQALAVADPSVASLVAEEAELLSSARRRG